MRKKERIVFLSSYLVLFLFFVSPTDEKSNNWQKWLDEVDLIITKAERAVFKTLKTEEDRTRFQASFWEIRDNNPNSPENDYKIEFYKRLKHADLNLGGTNSDRARIYILLGEPFEKKKYVGNEQIVDCELWSYKGGGRPGLPHHMYIIFFKIRNIGTYKLFHPGPQTSWDILSPGYQSNITSISQSYRLLRSYFPELARATLSIIPEEGDSMRGTSLSSSGYVLTQIFQLPEKEVNNNYLRNFTSLNGVVDISYSTKAIGGKGGISISQNSGIKFLNYSILPDVVHTKMNSGDLNTAELTLNLKIENLEGKTIYQKERAMDLRLTDTEKVMIEERKIVFKDFIPIVEGEFNVSIIFTNRTTDEFYIYKEYITINDETVPILVGFKIKKTVSENFVPFSTGKYRVISDPQFIFNKDDFLEGIVCSNTAPKIFLSLYDEKDNYIEIIPKREGNYFRFSQALKDLESQNYLLSIENNSEEVYKKIVSILPFHVEKPVAFETTEPASSQFNYVFLLAQQYLNKGEVDRSIEFFEKLPEDLWNSTTLPIIARAYYIKGNYEKVIELLDPIQEKNYSVLSLLANSLLVLKRLEKSAEYFEILRKYGDTAKINMVLGEIYYLLGDDEKAKAYKERATKLKKD